MKRERERERERIIYNATCAINTIIMKQKEKRKKTNIMRHMNNIIMKKENVRNRMQHVS